MLISTNEDLEQRLKEALESRQEVTVDQDQKEEESKLLDYQLEINDKLNTQVDELEKRLQEAERAKESEVRTMMDQLKHQEANRAKKEEVKDTKVASGE